MTTFHDEVGAFLRETVGAENVRENVTIRIGETNLNYRFAAAVKKMALTTKKGKDEAGESIEVPCFSITLELVDERAISVAQHMAGFQGVEIVCDVEGDGRQLSL